MAWAPSVEGPESLTLFIAVGIYAATKLAEGFLSELSTDIYTWAKTKILPLLNKKRYHAGHIIIKLKDVTLDCYVELHYEADQETLLLFIKEFPEILNTTDAALAKEWLVSYDRENKK